MTRGSTSRLLVLNMQVMSQQHTVADGAVELTERRTLKHGRLESTGKKCICAVLCPGFTSVDSRLWGVQPGGR
ncbi:hypothetical protein CgunFtcFv8_002532 [Champsocephalus gunnari]|uniref:Uncharacterized protein n=1 Tax=Champsocephalus gunnari TaxID=52237 RepID=A0AAN8DA25_CHAGU|nr:hypothetical protein CgunFtcFv8_002532 [Champsocephalus gunnari]